MRFEPDLRNARREAILAAAASFLVAPVYFWWKGVRDIVAGVLITLFAFAVLTARALWTLFGRGLDTVVLNDEGVHLARRRTAMSFPWQDIHRVYRFGDTLVFESQAPHRRYVFLLEGHEQHTRELVAALAERARTMDLRWVDALGELG